MEKFAKQFSNEEEEELKEKEDKNKEEKEEEEEIKEKEEEMKKKEEEEENSDGALLSLDDVSPDQVKIYIFNELCLNLQLIVISKIFPAVTNNNMAVYFINITNLLIYLM